MINCMDVTDDGWCTQTHTLYGMDFSCNFVFVCMSTRVVREMFNASGVTMAISLRVA